MMTKCDNSTWVGSGAQGAQTPALNPFRNHPMFFRNNGAPIDLIDIYRNHGLFLCLNGPSLLNHPVYPRDELLHLLHQPGVITMGVNNGGHVIRPDLWACVDNPANFMESIWMDPRIQKFVPMHHFEARTSDDWYVREHANVIGFRRNEHLLPHQFLSEPTINWGNHGKLGGGRSVMLAALRIAFLLGFRRVYLLGCDFHMADDSKYFFPQDRTKSAIKGNMHSYALLREFFKALQPYFLAARFHVFNCTEGSKLKVFPSVSLTEALTNEVAHLRPHLVASTEGMYESKDNKE